TDSRVVNREGLNARDLIVSLLPASEYDRIVIDLSFISITLILENVWPLLSGSGAMIALVKPQFEAGREAVSKGRGVIRDDETRHNIRRRIERFAWDALPGCSIPETIECPLPGSDGNREFLMLLQKQQHERQNMCQAPSDSARARSRGNE
ncbi:MAG: SAM-dependent methyltransferase, partial [Planctomycetota bacterium]